MSVRYLKKADLVTRPGTGRTPPQRGRYPFSASTLWRRIKDGRFPAPVVIAGIPCWPVDVLEQWEREQGGAL